MTREEEKIFKRKMGDYRRKKSIPMSAYWHLKHMPYEKKRLNDGEMEKPSSA